MRVRLKDLLKQCFSQAVIYYCLFAVLIIKVVDVDNAKMARVNNLQDVASYPALYLSGKAVFDERMFRLAKKYYEAFVYAVPLYAANGFVDGPVALSRTYMMLAVCDDYLGQSAEAAQFLRKALDQEPRHFWLNYNLGLVYFKRGEYDTAVRYLERSFNLQLTDVDQAMELDYLRYWPSSASNTYRILNLVAFHEVVIKSYELSVLAYEKMGDRSMMKDLAAAARRSGIGQESGLLTYYAGASLRKPDVDMRNYQLMVNPAVYFLPIGKEKFVANKYFGDFKVKP